jgi:hypothetical protein
MCKFSKATFNISRSKFDAGNGVMTGSFYCSDAFGADYWQGKIA